MRPGNISVCRRAMQALVLGLCSTASGFSQAQTVAEFVSGSQVKTVTFSHPIPGVTTPVGGGMKGHVFVDLGANVEPLALAIDGTIACYADVNLARWKAGALSLLQAPEYSDKTGSYSGYWLAPGFSRASQINRNGWILVDAMDSFDGGNCSSVRPMVWENGTTIPYFIEIPITTFREQEYPYTTLVQATGIPCGLDDTNRVWARVSTGSDWETRVYFSIRDYFRPDPDLGKWEDLCGVRADGDAFGKANYPGVESFYAIGAPRPPCAVDFCPLGLNLRGDVLGADCVSNFDSGDHSSLDGEVYAANLLQSAWGVDADGAIVKTVEGTVYELPEYHSRLVGLDDEGNVYG